MKTGAPHTDHFFTRLTVAGLAVALSMFAVFKLYGIHFVRGDEHLYNYMSLLILDGLIPYRDFHHSHPPLPVYLNAMIFAAAGYSLFAAKLIPMLAAASSAIHIYLLGRRGFGAVEGLIAAVLFLFTFDVLRGSNHATGINLALALMLAATYQSVLKRPGSSGVLLGLGTLCGVYVVPMFLMIATLTLLRSLRDATRLIGGFVSVCAAVFGIFLVSAGTAIVDQVFVFNWQRAPMPYDWWEKSRHVFFLNLPLMSGFVPGIVWGVARWGLAGRTRGVVEVEPRLPRFIARAARWLAPWGSDRLGFALLMVIFACGYLFFYANLKVFLSYYFMLVMPFMALITAFAIIDPVRHGLALIGGLRPHLPAWRDADARAAGNSETEHGAPGETTNWRVGAIPLVAAVLAYSGTWGFAASIESQRIETRGDRTWRYTFVPSPYLSETLNGIVRTLFWREVRDPKQPVRGITRYLQHESRHATTIDRFIAGVRKVCRPGESIFGEYSLGPFGASVSDCRLAADLVDINNTRVLAGDSTIAEWIRAVEQDGLDIAIWRTPSVYGRDAEMRRYILGTFPRVVFRWDDPHMGAIELRRRG
jgi:hypothetical protein